MAEETLPDPNAEAALPRLGEPASGGPQPASSEELPDDYAAAPAAPAPAARVMSWVRAHWLLTSVALAVLGIGALILYALQLASQASASQDPTAASTENIARQLPRANTRDAVAPVATESMDLKARAEKNEQPSTVLSADTLNRRNAALVEGTLPMATSAPAQALPVDTTGQAAAARQRERLRQQRINRTSLAREAHRRNVDTVTTTERDATTGAYVTRTRTVQRSSSGGGGGGGGGGRSSRVTGSRGRTPAEAKLPLFAPDGVPYEDNEEVNRMLAASPPEARTVYEQMTGHRYRPIATKPSADQVRNVLAATPGMDGFFTVKLRKADGSAAEDKPIDVFFKCQINGAQRVVTGSVVMLRLTEDAVLDGRTFPKNLIFAGVAAVSTNNIVITVERLGPTKVACQLFDYNYMPGIMIDPGKRAPLDPGAVQFQQSMRNSTTSELTSAIDRSASAANSLAGISARVGSSLITRIPRKAPKLREILLPDGYPVLITSGRAGGGSTAAETSSSTTNGAPLPFLTGR